MKKIPQERNKQTRNVLFKIIETKGHLSGSAVECLILDFGSGYDLRVVRWSTMSGTVLSKKSA